MPYSFPVLSSSSASRLRPASSIIAIMGDSRVFIGSVPTAYSSSSTRSKSNRGFQFWAEALTGGRVSFPAELNFGVGGDTSAQILTRTPAAVAAAVAAGASAVVLLGCTTNDRTSGITYAQSIANCATIEAAFSAVGIAVIWIAEIPRGDSTFTAIALTGTPLDDHRAVEEWQGARSGAGVYVVRPWGEFSDQSSVANSALGYAKLNYTYDGLHPTPLGMNVIVTAALPLLTTLFPPREVLVQSGADVWSATNPNGSVNLNPLCLGSGGTAGTGITGVVANGWTAQHSLGTGSTLASVGSIIAPTDADPRNWQRFVTTGTAGSTFDALRFRFPVDAATRGVTPGNFYKASMAFRVTAGQAGVAQVACYIANEANVDFTQSGQASIQSDFYPVTTVDGVCVVESAALQAGATQAVVGARVVYRNGAVVNSTVDIGQISFQQV